MRTGEDAHVFALRDFGLSLPSRLLEVTAEMPVKRCGALMVEGTCRPARPSRGTRGLLLDFLEVEPDQLSVFITDATIDHGEPHIAAQCAGKERVEERHIVVEVRGTCTFERNGNENGTITDIE